MGIEQFIKKFSQFYNLIKEHDFALSLNLKKRFSHQPSGLKIQLWKPNILTNTKTEFPTPYFLKDEDTTFILQLPQSHYY
jgi:hypothetical protein